MVTSSADCPESIQRLKGPCSTRNGELHVSSVSHHSARLVRLSVNRDLTDTGLSEIGIPNRGFGIDDGRAEKEQLDWMAFENARSINDTYQAIFDTWVFPFMNVFAVLGKIDVAANPGDFDVSSDQPQVASWLLPPTSAPCLAHQVIKPVQFESLSALQVQLWASNPPSSFSVYLQLTSER